MASQNPSCKTVVNPGCCDSGRTEPMPDKLYFSMPCLAQFGVPDPLPLFYTPEDEQELKYGNVTGGCGWYSEWFTFGDCSWYMVLTGPDTEVEVAVFSNLSGGYIGVIESQQCDPYEVTGNWAYSFFNALRSCVNDYPCLEGSEGIPIWSQFEGTVTE